MKVIKFAPGLIPVFKHQQHDQSTHGSWADSGSPKLTILGKNDGVNEFFNESTRVVRYQPEGKEPKDYVLYANEDFVVALVKPTDGTTINGYSDGGTNKGEIGHLDITGAGSNPWRSSAKDDNKATIVEVAVRQAHQRRGLASAMLRFHRDLFPELDVQHSDSQLPEGKAWADVAKHQEHDQSTHGSWATGSRGRGSDITEECKSYFGTNVMEYQTSEAKREIQKRTDSARIMGKGHENYILEIVAEKQGFDGKPKVVSSDEIDQLEKDGWTVAYRGIKDFSVGDKGAIKFKAEDLAEEFRTGNYHAGAGTDGDGLYFTTDKTVAESYAGWAGEVVKVAIPPNSVLTPDIFHAEIQSHREKISRGGVGDFWGADDIGVSLASKGFRAAQSLRKMVTQGGYQVRIAPVFVIWDRSMLAVEEAKSK